MPKTIANKKYLTVKEVSKVLSVSISTVGKYINEGKIESLKLGGRILIPEPALNEFMKEVGLK
jgi:excisionase family DNA binding protein